MHYNFCRPHTTLTKAAHGVKTTPAMASGVTDHVWALAELLALVPEPKAAPWGSKKRYPLGELGA